MSPAAVADLVERARDESLPPDRRHSAFDELVRAFEGMALSSALRLLDDAEEARDAAQEALLAAWQKLRQLRTPEAFGGWLKRLVSTQCNRRRQWSRAFGGLPEPCVPPTVERQHDRSGLQGPMARAFANLPEAERRAMVLFYVFGYKIDEIAAMVGAPRATVGKRLYAARLRIRRELPRSIREQVLRLSPSADFVRTVRKGLFDDYVGEYRFERRPDLVVRIEREPEGLLVSHSQGQRNVLVSIGDGVLATAEFDGEGHFERDATGRIARFVYYEFGARMGVAMKVRVPAAPESLPRA